MRDITIASDAEDLYELAAEAFIQFAREAVEERGVFYVALSGGSTPKAMYHLLTTEAYRDRVQWNNVKFYFGDERFVPPAADQSNFRMAYLNLFKPLSIPPANIFRWKTEIGETKHVARQYEQQISEMAADGMPVFDLFLLGMGPDGHVASLFPHSKALTETQHLAVPNWIEKLHTWRLTMTYAVINRSRTVMFLVSGEEKAEALRDVLESKKNPEHLPAQGVKPKDGRLLWFVDEGAAKYLKHKASSVHN